jgi:hypothetical protein
MDLVSDYVLEKSFYRNNIDHVCEELTIFENCQRKSANSLYFMRNMNVSKTSLS